MMNQLEMNETELLAIALKQLKSDGKIPDLPITVYPSRSSEPDDEGQYTFIYRWRELSAIEVEEWKRIQAFQEGTE